MLEFVQGTLNSLLVVVGIGVLIFVHELGHFLVAKKVGIRVEAFSLGFGPKLFGFHRGGTDYKVCAIPLGGYVKMAGEYGSDPTADPVGDEFFAKSIGQRAWVVSAGVIMNVIFAVIAFPIAFSLGVPFESAEIAGVVPDGPAWHAGLRSGDEVIAADGTEVLGLVDVVISVAFSGDPVRFTVLRDGVRRDVVVSPRWDDAKGRHEIGIGFRSDFVIAPKSSLIERGFAAGDVITAIDGRPSEEIARGVELAEPGADGKPVRLSIRHASTGEVETVELPALLEVDAGTDGTAPKPRAGIVRARHRIAHLRELADAEGGVPIRRLNLSVGDEFLDVNGRPVFDETTLRAALRAGLESGRTVVRVRRPGEALPIESRADLDADDLRLVEDSVALATGSLKIRVLPDSAAAAAGLTDGDELMSIASDEVRDDHDAAWARFVDAVGNAKDASLAVRVRRGDEIVEAAIHPIIPKLNKTLDEHVALFQPKVTRRIGFPESLAAGARQAWLQTEKILLTLRSLVMGDISARNMGGIITIARESYHAADQKFSRLIFVMAILSLNLAVLNILPIPILDGGHLVFLILEKIKGGPISERAMTWANVSGLVFILGLTLFVTYNDIVRLVTG